MSFSDLSENSTDLPNILFRVYLIFISGLSEFILDLSNFSFQVYLRFF